MPKTTAQTDQRGRLRRVLDLLRKVSRDISGPDAAGPADEWLREAIHELQEVVDARPLRT